MCLVLSQYPLLSLAVLQVYFKKEICLVEPSLASLSLPFLRECFYLTVQPQQLLSLKIPSVIISLVNDLLASWFNSCFLPCLLLLIHLMFWYLYMLCLYLPCGLVFSTVFSRVCVYIILLSYIYILN